MVSINFKNKGLIDHVEELTLPKEHVAVFMMTHLKMVRIHGKPT